MVGKLVCDEGNYCSDRSHVAKEYCDSALRCMLGTHESNSNLNVERNISADRFGPQLCHPTATERARTIWMGGIRPNWDAAKVMMLFCQHRDINQAQSCCQVEAVTIKRKGWRDEKGELLGFALIRFDSEAHANLALGLAGMPIPDTPDTFSIKPNIWKQGETSMVEQGLACKVEEPTVPSLQQQLEPLTISQLRQRLQTLGCATTDVEQQAQAAGGRLAKKQALLDLLCECYRDGRLQRTERHTAGTPIPSELLEPLLNELRSLRWPVKKRKVQAEQYMVLGIPAAGSGPKLLDQYPRLWELCSKLMQSLAANFQYSSVAVTKNFVSSPHVDMNDRSYQFALSLGDFHSGGELCVEASHEEVLVVDTKAKLAKVDGRFPHWVRPYEGKERFSLIFYRVTGEFCAPEAAMPE
eukprot:TRINITY_DN75915_c0_g1_i1.p1 TRINITY_DN75915_c0_g1~~TRINITY_DN75915_c0_g1_i1.p1  ORF type:complete len:412 (+),score=65.80 TRINITY_DN75915_c0_g1_i1:109-1344(+)